MCECKDVEMGSYDNQIILGFYPVMREYRENRLRAGLTDLGICVDRCIADEVIELWENEIRTYGCCCGHNKVPGMINVDERDFDKALSLGWEMYCFENEPDRRDTVKPKGEKRMSENYLDPGTLLGLCDSAGNEFYVGAKVKRKCECNPEMHGAWVIYKVKLQGTTPILSYFISEKGQVLPVGYTAGILCNEYDHKMFCFASDSKSLRPEDESLIIMPC